MYSGMQACQSLERSFPRRTKDVNWVTDGQLGAMHRKLKEYRRCRRWGKCRRDELARGFLRLQSAHEVHKRCYTMRKMGTLTDNSLMTPSLYFLHKHALVHMLRLLEGGSYDAFNTFYTHTQNCCK